jgi:ribosome-associated protein
VTDAKPSKSARKREQLALQKLGEQLIGLTDTELEKLPVGDELGAAVRTARGMRAHGALRRQRQLIGKLMRSADADAIRAALASLKSGEQQARRRFAAAEHWRDRLVSDGAEALTAFESETGRKDDELRELVVAAQRNADERQEKTRRRRIFRRVHEMLADVQ